MKLSEPAREIRCSFCHKGKSVVGVMISSPADYRDAFICDECVAICASMIEDHKSGEYNRQQERNQRVLFYTWFGFTIQEAVEYVTAQ